MSEQQPPDEPAPPSRPKAQKQKPGLVLINTGDGKGKTTAALGTAIRHAGYGRKVLIIQFIKGTWHYGELESLARIPEITLVRAGAGFYKILDDKFPEEVHRQAAAEGLALARSSVASGEYSLVVLDEIIYAIDEKLLSLEQVLELLTQRRPEVSVILTGRHAPQALIDQADTVTEMKEIKHPFRDGILALKGIDY
ncbi:MAG: cob(I)yrinic acid a,c-diamide adenosyltransferase [Myxococcales bacterium]|nr:cob(I)yrinic acid a,c-diamide adenosyltransferase [Myxococcales bacterium]